MPVPRKLLDKGEQVVVDVRPHPWVLVRPLLVVIVVVAGSATAAAYRVPTVVAWMLVVVLAVVLARLLGRYLRWRSTSLVVTNLRLVDRRGVMSRITREIPIARVTDVTCRQGLFGRLIGAGDLLIESAGRDSAEVFALLPRPATVQRDIETLIAMRQGAGAPATASLSIPEQLERLDDLRRRGILTDAELAATKAKLLGSP